MLASKISITFKHDWSNLIKKYDYLKTLLNNSPKAKSKWVDAYKAERFDFGESGSYVSFDTNTLIPGTASSLNGKIVENMIPWIDQLKNDLSELKLANIGFQGNYGSIERHNDNKDESGMEGHCKLNYIIDNSNTISYAERDGIVESYPSEKDTGWLLDTTTVHWVEGEGQRYLFQLTFDQPFSEVLEWFEKHPNLVYGE